MVNLKKRELLGYASRVRFRVPGIRLSPKLKTGNSVSRIFRRVRVPCEISRPRFRAFLRTLCGEKDLLRCKESPCRHLSCRWRRSRWLFHRDVPVRDLVHWVRTTRLDGAALCWHQSGHETSCRSWGRRSPCPRAHNPDVEFAQLCLFPTDGYLKWPAKC